MEEPEELLCILLHFLCSQYPSGTDSITISCPLHQHQVSPEGMHLLHLATSAMEAQRWTITEVRVFQLLNFITTSLVP